MAGINLVDNKISAFVMAIIGIAIVLAIGLLVMGEIKTSQYETDSSIEDILARNDTNTTFVTIAGVDGSAVSISSVVNGTQTISSANYAFTPSLGSIAFITAIGDEWNGTRVNVTYSFTNHSDASYSLAKNITNLAKVPTWIGILITVALAFIVLSYFYGRAR